MYTLTHPTEYQADIKKSRFIARAVSVTTTEAAREWIAKVSDAGATHNCWAYRLAAEYRFSDDGEPSGTAGKPIYTAIERQQFDQVVIVVTRYFGGIKLGAGGLVRAYGGTAATCLQQAARKAIRNLLPVLLECGFEHSHHLHDILTRLNLAHTRYEYTDQGLQMQLEIDAAQLETLTAMIRDACRGAVRIEWGERKK